MGTIENDIPEVFLELAREGFALGLEKIQLGFYYLDSDFRSPIEWALWLFKRTGRSQARQHVVLTMGRSTEEDSPVAYISSSNGNPQIAEYWGPDKIRSWLQEPLEAEGEYTRAWSPVTDPELQKVLLAQWPLFETGVRNGWVMQRSMDWSNHDHMLELFERLGRPLEPKFLLPPLKFDWSGHNSFYNMKGHPSHRKTGAPISISGWSSLRYDDAERFYEHGENEDGHPVIVELSREHVEELLSSNHPWFIRVALNDQESDEWMHFPEALQHPEFTLSTDR